MTEKCTYLRKGNLSIYPNSPRRISICLSLSVLDLSSFLMVIMTTRNNKTLVEMTSYCDCVLPIEIIIEIFVHLKHNPTSFSIACRLFHTISLDPLNRARYLFMRYGRDTALFTLFEKHSSLLSPDLTKHLLWTLDVPVSACLIYRLAHLVNQINRKNMKHSNYIEQNYKTITASKLIHARWAEVCNTKDYLDNQVEN